MPELKEFQGRWAIERQIDDARAGSNATFRGEASFDTAGDGMLYRETGTLILPGQPPMQATRSYLWRQAAERIDLYFSDGRFFHSIGPGPAPTAEHDCPPDFYRVAYDFTGWPAWQATWHVTGPRKDFVMQSRYRYQGRI